MGKRPTSWLRWVLGSTLALLGTFGSPAALRAEAILIYEVAPDGTVAESTDCASAFWGPIMLSTSSQAGVGPRLNHALQTCLAQASDESAANCVVERRPDPELYHVVIRRTAEEGGSWLVAQVYSVESTPFLVRADTVPIAVEEADAASACELLATALTGGETPDVTRQLISDATRTQWGESTIVERRQRMQQSSIASLQPACDGGSLQHCHEALMAGRTGLVDLAGEQTVVDGMTQNCEAGGVASCRWLADAVRLTLGPDAGELLAREYLTRACEREDSWACVERGVSLVVRPQSEDEFLQGVAILEDECDARSFRACDTLSRLHNCAQASPALLVETDTRMRARCEDGNATACHAAIGTGGGLSDELPTGAMAEQAVDFARRACDAGLVAGCGTLGTFLMGGLTGIAEWEAGAALLQRACDAGNGLACSDRADFLAGEDPRTASLDDIIRLYSRACIGRVGSACTIVGSYHVSDEAEERSVQLATLFWRLGCNDGEPDSCARLGGAYIGGGPGVPRDEASGLAYVESACAQDSVIGCFFLGGYLDARSRTPEEAQRVIDAFTFACEGGHVEACTNLAYALARGETGQPDFPEAARYFGRACTRQHGEACRGLGTMMLEFGFDVVGEADVIPWFDTACEAGVEEGCFWAGYLIASGDLDTDRVEAVPRLTRSCEMGNALGCLEAARLAFEFTPTDYEGITSILTRGCELGDPDTCYLLGAVYYQSDDFPQDFAISAAAWSTGCVLGDGEACAGLSLLYSMGSGVAADPVRAVELAEMACRKDSSTGCFLAGEFHFTGAGVPANPARANEFWVRSCELGNPQACQMLR